jgi:hypothetical protein
VKSCAAPPRRFARGTSRRFHDQNAHKKLNKKPCKIKPFWI